MLETWLKTWSEWTPQKTWSQWTPTQRVGVIALVVLALGLLCYFIIPDTMFQNKFDEIATDMTLADVEEILGPGEEMWGTDRPSTGQGDKAAFKTMKGGHGKKQIIVVFKDGKVYMKHYTSR